MLIYLLLVMFANQLVIKNLNLNYFKCVLLGLNIFVIHALNDVYYLKWVNLLFNHQKRKYILIFEQPSKINGTVP